MGFRQQTTAGNPFISTKHMITERITSPNNPKIRRLLNLQQKSSARRSEGVFIVEGRREIQHCIDAGYELETLFYCPSLTDDAPLPPCRHIEVNAALYERIAYRGTTEGLVAEVRTKTLHLENLINTPTLHRQHNDSNAPLFVVLESVEKPGNLGAILRSADAAGVDGVIVCDPLTDLYNPNLIRSSLGAIFTVPTIACTSDDCIAFLRSHGIRILTAQLQDSHLYYDTDMQGPTAIVMGTEATGLTTQWREVADAHIRIPMLGRLDSLNVSVSAAILMFEAVRQRNL